MKKGFLIFLVVSGLFNTMAQEKPVKETAKDSVKTEIVNVVTRYNPKIADASKIKTNPKIKLLKKSEKQKLEYRIFSVPVASTFIPKSGVIKGIDVGVRERIYKNFVAASFGNYASPYLEAFLYHSTRFENEFGISANYSSSEDTIQNTLLNSTFSNFKAAAYYKQEDRYFDWKVSLKSEINNYNWYGLPNLNFTTAIINSIEEEQVYNYFELGGELNFEDSYIDYAKVALSYFTDTYHSNEVLLGINGKLNLPLDFLQLHINDIGIPTSLELLKGEFKNSYKEQNPINYSLITAKIQPEYAFSHKILSVKYGAKFIVSLDTENKATNFFVFPELHIRSSIIKNYLNAYGGFTGDLHTNTYKSFTEENPFVSPTLFMTQTAEKSNFFIGIKSKVNNALSFHLKISTKNEEDKPLFIRNNSKSDGTNQIANGNPIKGYEYGNSFGVFYDDVKTTTLFAEVAYDFTKRITFAANIQQDSYTVNNAIKPFNLPSLQASFTAKYKSNKWYATSNVFYVSERKDVNYNGSFPSSFSEITTVDSFIDVNLGGGYHFNDRFSAFLRLNNILDTQYERFANFETQGFQILGGVSYKFDF
jgi:hypothetical protein